MDEPPTRERTPWLRYAGAATLGLSILAMTYVLFDPDLGTEAPLFGEFTCRGALEVDIANGFYQPWLQTPASAVYYNATREGHHIRAYVTLYVREGGVEWSAQLSRTDEPSEGFIYIPIVTPTTEAYVEARDTSGETCAGNSETIRAADAPATTNETR